jgi:5-carboxymethyl-2-hydroxymuconate isomerase
MPHLVLEYSANLPNVPELGAVLRRLHEALVAAGPFDLAKIKSRAVRLEVFRVADGAPDRSFVHLTAAVLDGREAAVLESAREALLAVLREDFAAARAAGRCDVTLEVREMPRRLYGKAGP